MKKIFNKVVFIRHGESLANIENRFTGWLDVDLTKNGYNQALEAGLKMKKLNFKFDLCYTSLLKRAIRTVWGILDGLNSLYIPIKKTLYLNERHYGVLSGLNINEAILKFGKKKVLSWLNCYKDAPPKLPNYDIRYLSDLNKYKNLRKQIPRSESLQDTFNRILKVWNKSITNEIKLNKSILVVSHSNILKTLMKHLDENNSNKMNLIKNSTPIIYEFDENLKKINSYSL